MHTVSIGIPTYNRPQFLRQALESCRRQSYTDFEIIVSDDSTDDACEAVASTFAEDNPSVSITYARNMSRLGQAGNVNQLFRMAQGEFFVLLHDDDLFLESALEHLVNAMKRRYPLPAVVYGKLLVINDGGLLMQDHTIKLNKAYSRSSEMVGLQQDALRAAILQQVPPDGYLIPTRLAQSVRYESEDVCGNACDADFMIRVARTGIEFYYFDEYVTAYRLSAESITTSGNLSSAYFRLLVRLADEPELRNSVNVAMTRVSISALKEYALVNRRSDAWNIYWSQWYPWRRRLTLKGLYHMMFILWPRLAQLILRSKNARIQ